jgi:hypothetical protein
MKHMVTVSDETRGELPQGRLSLTVAFNL